jgi:chemotaxis signal transduction protein
MAKTHRKQIKLMGRASALNAEERMRRLVEERTQALASRPAKDANAPSLPTRRVLTCRVGRELFGIPVEDVAEVTGFRPFVPAPMPMPGLVGHLGRAGQLLSLIDLPTALGLPDLSPASGHLILLRGSRQSFVLHAERVEDVSTVTVASTNEDSAPRSRAVTAHAVHREDDAEQTISLIDLDALLEPFLSVSRVPGA